MFAWNPCPLPETIVWHGDARSSHKKSKRTLLNSLRLCYVLRSTLTAPQQSPAEWCLLLQIQRKAAKAEKAAEAAKAAEVQRAAEAQIAAAAGGCLSLVGREGCSCDTGSCPCTRCTCAGADAAASSQIQEALVTVAASNPSFRAAFSFGQCINCKVMGVETFAWLTLRKSVWKRAWLSLKHSLRHKREIWYDVMRYVCHKKLEEVFV